MLKPALTIGPFLGALGGLLVLALAVFGSGGAGAGGLVMVALFVGVILGLIVATPLALIAGAVMLRMATVDARWTLRRAWAFAGFVVGGVTGGLFGGLGGDTQSLLLVFALFAFLGVAGALLCRRMLNRKLATLNEVDADIFA